MSIQLSENKFTTYVLGSGMSEIRWTFLYMVEKEEWNTTIGINCPSFLCVIFFV